MNGRESFLTFPATFCYDAITFYFPESHPWIRESRNEFTKRGIGMRRDQLARQQHIIRAIEASPKGLTATEAAYHGKRLTSTGRDRTNRLDFIDTSISKIPPQDSRRIEYYPQQILPHAKAQRAQRKPWSGKIEIFDFG